jgi:arsenic resistance protein ArsH
MRNRVLKALVTLPSISDRFYTTAFFNRSILAKFRGGASSGSVTGSVTSQSPFNVPETDISASTSIDTHTQTHNRTFNTSSSVIMAPSTTNTNTNTNTNTTTSDSDASIYTYEDKEAFASLNHPGYSTESDPQSHAGGWLAHRAGVDKDTCWVKNIVGPKLTRYDYSSLPIGRPPKILVLYGSLRSSSFSKKLAYEFARILEELGCDVRTYNPHGLPVRDPDLEHQIKVQEIRALTQWSDGHMWVSPEMHGQLTGVFKNQIDWIPLNTGSVRPTQGKTCCVAQVNGGSQSFNAVNSLRLLARWMRMPCVTNQSSVPKAWQEFGEEDGRMKDSSLRDRVVDCSEEFAKFAAVMAPISDDLTDRYSERKEKEKEGRLLTQAEKEVKETVTEARKA